MSSSLNGINMDIIEKDQIKKEVISELINCVRCVEQKNRITSIIGVLTLISVFGFFAGVTYFFRSRTDIIMQLITIFQSVLTLVMAYYFGTSKSSDDKNKTIDKILNKNNGVTNE